MTGTHSVYTTQVLIMMTSMMMMMMTMMMMIMISMTVMMTPMMMTMMTMVMMIMISMTVVMTRLMMIDDDDNGWYNGWYNLVHGSFVSTLVIVCVMCYGPWHVRVTFIMIMMMKKLIPFSIYSLCTKNTHYNGYLLLCQTLLLKLYLSY